MPAVLLAWVPVRRTPWRPQLWRNASLFILAIAVTLAGAFAMFSRIAPLVRNNMHLRYIVNPIAGFGSAIAVGVAPYFRKSKPLVPITAGTALGASYAGQAKPPLLVLVVGETARADHFSLNGYARDTNPELAAAGVLSFRDVLLVRHRHARLGAVHVLAARQGGVREAQRRAREPARRAAGGGAGRALARQPGRLQGGLRPRAERVDRRPAPAPSPPGSATPASASTTRSWSASTSGSPGCRRNVARRESCS